MRKKSNFVNKTSKFSYCSLVKCLLNKYKPHGVPFLYTEKNFQVFAHFCWRLPCFTLVFPFFVRFTGLRRKICTLAGIFVELSNLWFTTIDFSPWRFWYQECQPDFHISYSIDHLNLVNQTFKHNIMAG